MRSRALPIVCMLAALDASAANFAVNSTDDLIDAVPGNGFCSVMTGICTLRAAIQEANALPGADVIQLPAGTFVLSIAGANEDLAATGDLDILDDVTIEGESAATTVLDANSIDRVFHVPPSGLAAPSVTIRNVTIRNGAVTDARGAGIHHDDDGSLLVEDAVLGENVVSGSSDAAIGGAIASTGVGVLELRRVRLHDNQADRGGAIFYNGTLAAWDSTITTNTARDSSAISAYGDGSVERCTISANQVGANTYGATIGVYRGSFTLLNSTLSGNTSGGPLILAIGDALGLGLGNVTVTDNTATAAVSAGSSSNLTILNSVLVGTSGDECSFAADIGVVAVAYNLDDDDTCGSGPGDIPAQDPLLGPLADNGGPTLTHLPAPSSPLANAGSPLVCPLEDQRGTLRNVGPTNGCDVGAVEFSVPEAEGLLASAAVLAALGIPRRRA